MKLSTMEGTAILLLAGVVAYSAGSVAGHADGATRGLDGDWQAAFTLDHAYPARDEAGRTVAARVHIGTARPPPSRSTGDERPRALEGDLGVFGLRGGGLRGARVQPARADSVRVTLGAGARAVELVGHLECGRVTGRWRHASRAETETGRFELRRITPGPAPRDIHGTGDEG
jgi:hypothetical protein